MINPGVQREILIDGINPATEEKQDAIIAALGGSSDEVTIVDEASATISYVGKSSTATTSGATWQIRRLDSTSGLVVLRADGNQNYDNVWDNRALLSYS